MSELCRDEDEEGEGVEGKGGHGGIKEKAREGVVEMMGGVGVDDGGEGWISLVLERSLNAGGSGDSILVL